MLREEIYKVLYQNGNEIHVMIFKLLAMLQVAMCHCNKVI